MFEVKNLRAGYSGLQVVHNVSFDVRQGQILGLVGSNGSGKTTSLKAVTGLIKPMGGEVIFNGENVTGLPAHVMTGKGVVMVPEGRHLFGKMSIQDNLLMGAYLIKDKQKQQEKLEEVYAIFPRVKERLKQTAETLSGGEQQMVAIARGLMSYPKVLILDEPSLGIMPKLVSEIFEFILRIKETGVTIILVEQNVNETLKIADYVFVVQNGETVLSGTGAEMNENDDIKKAYLGL